MSSSFATVSLMVLALATTAACKKKSAEGVGANASPSSTAHGPAAPRGASFEARTAQSKPIEPKPEPVDVAGSKLTAEKCDIEGEPLLGKAQKDLMRSIRVVGSTAYLTTPEGSIRAYTISATGPCKLSPDKAFGEDGVLKLPHRVSRLSVDTAGHLLASSGDRASTRLTGAKVDFTCDVHPLGLVEVHPAGKMGIGVFDTATVAKVTFDDKGCKSEPWAFRDLGQPDKRKGPLARASAVGFLGDTILVGGVLAKDVDPNGSAIVIALDAAGKEERRFGSTERGTSEDRFAWVHAIAPCKPGLCVLDSDSRRITFWKPDGKYVGFAPYDKLFGLDRPWSSTFASTKGGVTYFAVAEERQKTGVFEGAVFRVTGL